MPEFLSPNWDLTCRILRPEIEDGISDLAQIFSCKKTEKRTHSGVRQESKGSDIPRLHFNPLAGKRVGGPTGFQVDPIVEDVLKQVGKKGIYRCGS